MPHTVAPSEDGRCIIVKVMGGHAVAPAAPPIVDANELGAEPGIRTYMPPCPEVG